jgi:23S rRNA (cytosine1962-C5)-methyltransferase
VGLNCPEVLAYCRERIYGAPRAGLVKNYALSKRLFCELKSTKSQPSLPHIGVNPGIKVALNLAGPWKNAALNATVLGMVGGYTLIDSGKSERLERFGDKILARPSSLAVWKRNHLSLWNDFDATFVHDDGWQFKGNQFEEWGLDVCGVKLVLRLQRNGQIGFFPEHTSYMPDLDAAVLRFKAQGSQAPQLLNLFAFTGMASMVAAKSGAQVTHVDILKPALDWARRNAAENLLPETAIRFIPEEALTFLRRELKRGKSYQIIILDPPGFSRVAKNQSWDLEEVLLEMVSLTTKLIAPGGEIYFTSHGAEHGGTMVANLYRDALPDAEIEARPLQIPENQPAQGASSIRYLPAGYLVHTRLKG